MPQQVFFRNSLETLYPAFTPTLVEYLLGARTNNICFTQQWADRFRHDLLRRRCVLGLVSNRACARRETNARTVTSQLGQSADLQGGSDQFEANIAGLCNETLARNQCLETI